MLLCSMDTVLNVLFYVAMLVLGLSILVIIHELGHFLPAKWFGMRVEKFFVFFDWPRKLWSFKKGDTEYGLGVLPLGGYVKISGIIDESFDNKHLSQPMQPWEFRAKPVWQRIIVMVGGVTMNVILAIVILAGITFFVGDQFVQNSSLKYGLYVHEKSIGKDLGFQTGDQLLTFKEEDLKEFPDDPRSFLLEENAYFTVNRGGETVRVDIPGGYLNSLSEKLKDPDYVPQLVFNVPPVVDQIAPGSPAEKAKLQSGDRILQVQGSSVASFFDIKPQLRQHPNQVVNLLVLRASDTLQVAAQLDSSAVLGINFDQSFIAFGKRDYGFFQSIGKGTARAFGILATQQKAFGKMFSGELDASKNLAGPLRIAKFIGDGVKSGGLLMFLNIIATLSMILAFVNILPIPALDGGHLVFLVWEGISGKEPSLKVRLAAQQVGVLIVILLSVFVFANDIINF